MAHAALRSTLAATVLTFTMAAAHADTVRIEFSGEMTNLGVYDYATSEFTPMTRSDFLGPTLSIGEQFNGYVDIDRSMPVLRKDPEGHWLSYEIMGSATQMHIENTAGTFVFQSIPKLHTYEGGVVSVEDVAAGKGTDRVSYRATGSYDTGYSNFVDFRVADPSGTALPDMRLPSSFNLQIFPDSTFSTTWMTVQGPNGGKEFVFTAQITSLQSVSAVPEPATWSALLAGFAVVGATGARRSRRKP